MYEYKCFILNVYDADTLACQVDLGMHVSLRLNIRLTGIDAPERGTEEGKAAIAWVNQQLADRGCECIVRTIKDRKEKYGRYLGVFTWGEWCLNDELVTAGHAVPYGGGKRA